MNEPIDEIRRGNLTNVDGCTGEWSAPAQHYGWLARPDRWERARPCKGVDSPQTAELTQLQGWTALMELDLQRAAECTAELRAATWDDARGWGDALGACLAYYRGDAEQATRSAAAAEERCRQDAVLRVEAQLALAHAAAARGEESEALSLARRASRMAQTEHLWWTHHRIALLLCRLRRLSGRSHLAALIAGRLVQESSPLLHALLSWELLFAGVLNIDAVAAAGPDGGAMVALAKSALRQGVSDGWYEGLPAPQRVDAAALDALARGTATPDASMTSWRRGESSAYPARVSGLCAALCSQGHRVVVEVTKTGATRAIRPGDSIDPPVLMPHGSSPARPEALLSVLALAGSEGLPIEVAFERTYGFSFRKELHEPTFKVVRHHTRALVSEHGRLWLEGDRMGIEVSSPFSIQDPRCDEPLEALLLRQVAAAEATGDSTSTKSIADTLGVSKRSVQNVLKQLVDDGTCVVERDGRRIAYSVEDTTFCAITVA